MNLSLKPLVAAAAVLAAVIVGVSEPAGAGGKLRAVASFSILGDLVSRVGGDRVVVTTVVGANGDAHVYEPKPGDAKAVAAAQVLVVNGLGFEGWLDRLVEASGYQGTTVIATEGIETHEMGRDHKRETGENGEPAEGEAGDDPGVVDPHAWQNAGNALIYVKNIAAALCTADAAGCAAYKANAESFSRELQAVDVEIKAAVARVPEARRTVITSHDSFGYFSHAYGIRFLAPEGIGTERAASARDVAKLIEQIREDEASALFVENIADPRLIEQIGEETGVEVGGELFSDALSDANGPAPTYIDMMRHNARLLTEAMLGS